MSISSLFAVSMMIGTELCGAQAPADLEAVELRHHHVEHDEVELGLGEALERFARRRPRARPRSRPCAAGRRAASGSPARRPPKVCARRVEPCAVAIMVSCERAQRTYLSRSLPAAAPRPRDRWVLAADRPAPLGSNLAPEAFDGPHAVTELKRLSARFPDPRPGSSATTANWPPTSPVNCPLVAPLEVASPSPPTPSPPRRSKAAARSRPFSRSGPAAPASRRLRSSPTATPPAHPPAMSSPRPPCCWSSRGSSPPARPGAASCSSPPAAVPAATPAPATSLLTPRSGSAVQSTPRSCSAISLALARRSSRPSPPRRSRAPRPLQRTLSQALGQQAALAARAPTLLDTLAQLSFPLAAGEQGPLDARGLPAVLLQTGSELPPSSRAPLSDARLEGFGRAALAAVYALDAGPEISSVETTLPVERKLLPEWAVRLLIAALLLPPLLTAGDGLARLRRRRRIPSERPLARSIAWVAACALPFLACALFATCSGRSAYSPPPIHRRARRRAARRLRAGGRPRRRTSARPLCYHLARADAPPRAPRAPRHRRRRPRAGAPARRAGRPRMGARPLHRAPARSRPTPLARACRPRTADWQISARAARARRARRRAARPVDRLLRSAARTRPGRCRAHRRAAARRRPHRLPAPCLEPRARHAPRRAAARTRLPARARSRSPDPGEEIPEQEILTIRGPMSYAGPGSLGGTESALRR